MENLVPKMYREYGLYTNKRKMLPCILDGLLPVQKRILLTAHTVARNKFVKTAKVLGENMARWHPHSEATGTAEWAVHNDFLLPGGQWGSTIGEEKVSCAAPRYTSIRANDLIEEMAFKFVNFVKWVPDEADPEPVAIPTMIPFCFMAKYEYISIGFGFKTEIPCYKKEDLIQRLLFLLGKRDEIIIIPNIIGCKILSSKSDCKKLLTEGKGKIELQGRCRISEKNKKISILGWNPRISFNPVLLKKIDSYNKWGLLNNGLIGYIDNSNGEIGTCIEFEVEKQRNRDQIFEKMKEAITTVLKASVSYNIIVIDNDDIKFSSVDDMLLKAYAFYKSSVSNYMISKLKNLNEIMSELEVIKRIKPYISETTNKSMDKVYETLSTRSGCSIDNIKRVIDKYKIKRLLSISTDVTNIKKELQNVKKDMKDLENVCINKYNKLLGDLKDGR